MLLEALLLALLATTDPAVGATLADTAEPVSTPLEDLQIFETPHAWIYTADPSAVPAIAHDLEAAAKAFHRHFGMEPRRGAICLREDLTWAETEALERDGAAWVLAWPYPGDDEGDDGRSLRHELGHVWFSDRVWRETSAPRDGVRYGDGAPDWLEEVAAILVEDATTTRQRRLRFARDCLGDPLRRRTMHLSELFAADHPGTYLSDAIRNAVLDWRERAELEGLSRGALRVDLGSRSDESSRKVRSFYAQCRSLVDYVQSKCPEAFPFRDLATRLRAGYTVDEWLSSLPADTPLPGSVEELDREWYAWARSRSAALVARAGIDTGR